ncbi:hypothetical protein C8R47DRAFT_1065519 [Mycena vitilis]|nr:hypothetical protein C8R47DRAFT_1065519 [Mycena vitilis]
MPRVIWTRISKICDTGNSPPMPPLVSTRVSKICDTGISPPLPPLVSTRIRKFCDTGTPPPMPGPVSVKFAMLSLELVKRNEDLYSNTCLEERDKNQASNELDSGPPKLKLREPPQDDWSRAAAAAAISAQKPLPHTLWSWGARLCAAARVPIAATTASSSKTPPQSSAQLRTQLKARAKAAAAMRAYSKDPLDSPCPHHHRQQLAAAKPFKTRFELSRIRTPNTGWIGLRDDGASTKEKVSGAAETGIAPTHLLSGFFGPTAKFLGFKLFKASREETPLIDSSSLVWGICSGIDNDPGFQADATAAAVVMEEARGKASLGDERTAHCCGNFGSLTLQETFTRHTSIFDDPSSTVFSLPAPSILALTPVPLAIETLPISCLAAFDYTKGGHLIVGLQTHPGVSTGDNYS